MNRIDKSPTKRSKKFVAGDHIVRSEYNDGVLRNNNRANNRLSKEMLLFEKAQKVILKDLGKETQLLRSKLQTSVTTTQKQNFAKNTNFIVEPYSVYSTRPKLADSPRKQKPSAAELGFDQIDSSGFYSHRSIGPRNGLLEPMAVQGKEFNSGSEKKRRSKKKLVQKQESVVDSTDRSSSSRTLASRLTMEESRWDLKSDRSGGIVTKMSMGRHDPSFVSDSRMSFIDILAEAEEKKAKESQQHITTLHVHKTESRPNSEVLHPRHRVTPNATLCTTPIE